MFCLPKTESDAFLAKIKDGSLNPEKLSEMTSDERREFFEEFMSKESAKQTNAQFESKLLLKNQQQGIINWAKKVSGISPEAQRDIIARVNKMDEVLNPKTQDMFLKDLAAHKLNATVTMEEAAHISELAKQSADTNAARDANTNNETILNYGKSKQAFGDYLDSLKPDPQGGIKNAIVNVLNIPKSALTSVLHFSAMGVQGWGMISTGRFWEAAGDQFKYFANEDNYKNAQAMISGHPDFEIAKTAGLGITSIDGKLNDREEAIQSSLIQKGSKLLSEKTGLPDVIRASSRAFTGFLNYTRFYRFEDLLNAARLNGEDVSKGSQVTKDLAKVVNDFTGRGSLPLGLDKATAALNTTFFSPRKMMATFDMFNPTTYLDPKTSPTARIAALRQLTGSLLVTGSVLGLARLAGAGVDVNPVSTNFGKVKLGNTTFDMTGGNAAYARLVARLISGKEKSSTGKVTKLGAPIVSTSKTGKPVTTPYNAPTRADEALSYLRDHLSPIASTVADWMAGTNAVGQPVTVKSELYNNLTPLVLQDYINMFKNDPKNTAAILPSLSAIFGVSMESDAPAPPKSTKK